MAAVRVLVRQGADEGKRGALSPSWRSALLWLGVAEWNVRDGIARKAFWDHCLPQFSCDPLRGDSGICGPLWRDGSVRKVAWAFTDPKSHSQA